MVYSARQPYRHIWYKAYSPFLRNMSPQNEKASKPNVPSPGAILICSPLGVSDPTRYDVSEYCWWSQKILGSFLCAPFCGPRYIYIYMLTPPPQGLPFHLHSLEKLIISTVGGEHIYIYIYKYVHFSLMLDTVSFIYYSAARSSNQVIQSISFFLVAMMSEASEISLETALNATNALFLKNLSKPNVVDLPRGPVSPTDLPLDHPILKETAKKYLFLTFFDGFSLKTCTGSKNCKKSKPGSSKTCTDSKKCKKCKTQIQCQRSGLDWPGLLHLLHFV